MEDKYKYNEQVNKRWCTLALKATSERDLK